MIKEFRTVTTRELRNLCIRRNWFTCGDNEDYEKLMQYSYKENLTTKDLEEMANIIVEFSEEENLEFFDPETDVMFELASVCITRFARKG